jgi:hypothetical protein
VSCNSTGTPGQDEASYDGVAVSVDVCGELVATPQVVLADGVESHRGSRSSCCSVRIRAKDRT